MLLWWKNSDKGRKDETLSVDPALLVRNGQIISCLRDKVGTRVVLTFVLPTNIRLTTKAIHDARIINDQWFGTLWCNYLFNPLWFTINLNLIFTKLAVLSHSASTGNVLDWLWMFLYFQLIFPSVTLCGSRKSWLNAKTILTIWLKSYSFFIHLKTSGKLAYQSLSKIHSFQQ